MVTLATTVEREMTSLIGRDRTKAALDAAELLMSGQSTTWHTQEIRNTEGLYMRRHFISQRGANPQVWLHEIMLPDADRWLHEHPWDYKTIILSGSYREEQQDGQAPEYDEGAVLDREAENLHRLHLTSPVVTLFIAGRRKRRWGFATDHGWVDAASMLIDPVPAGRTRW